MNKKILNYINLCEGWKVAIKSLHWDAKNMSQHELCDDIASEISDFEDLVSEVEQSISGKLPINSLKPKSYKIVSLKSFVEDVISSTQKFLKNLNGMGKKYVGIKSECETFIGVMQRKLYLVNFTLKEELKMRIRNMIKEGGHRKEENIRTVFPGTKPSSDSGILKRLEAISNGTNGQFNSRSFDSMGDAFEFFKRNLEKVGVLELKSEMDDICLIRLNAENGKSYNGMIDFIKSDDGKYKANIKFSSIGKEFSNEDEDYDEDDIEYEVNDIRESRSIRLSEGALKRFLNESITRVLNEGRNDELMKNVIDYILGNDELLNKAVSCLSPRFHQFGGGTEKQQQKWRMESFISENPSIFKGIMSLPLRKKIVNELYNILRMRYPTYFYRY